MIVKVELDNKEYFSYVFFECLHNYRDKYIVYNPYKEKLEFVCITGNDTLDQRLIFTYDYTQEKMIKKNEMKILNYTFTKCIGYSWLINNPSLIEDIINGNNIDEEYNNKAKTLNETIDIYKWHEVKTQKDIDELLYISSAFHDSYIKDIKGLFGKPIEPEVPMKFQIAFDLYGNHFDIMMEFEEEVYLNYAFSSYLNSIYLSSIIMHDGYIYWIEGDEELLPIDIPNHYYIKAKQLRWKIIPKLEYWN